MTADKVYNLIILDESGSMSSIKSSTISGFNEVVENIKEIENKFPEQQHFISFVSFNGIRIHTHLDRMPVSSINSLDERSYMPSSTTPLYDAIGNSVLFLDSKIGKHKDNNVLVTILTDGEENASKEYTSNHISRLVKQLEEHGWTFTYIGANQNSQYEGAKISITNTLNFVAKEEDMRRMFEQENRSRHNYSEKLRNREDKRGGYFD